jgi:hypothetical protein
MARRDDLARAPKPYNHLIASPVFSPNWGRGWLGYRIRGDTMEMWYVYGSLDASVEIEADNIFKYTDKWNSQVWLVFYDTREFHAFLLHPPEESVIFPLPNKLREFMEV